MFLVPTAAVFSFNNWKMLCYISKYFFTIAAFLFSVSDHEFLPLVDLANFYMTYARPHDRRSLPHAVIAIYTKFLCSKTLCCKWNCNSANRNLNVTRQKQTLADYRRKKGADRFHILLHNLVVRKLNGKEQKRNWASRGWRPGWGTGDYKTFVSKPHDFGDNPQFSSADKISNENSNRYCCVFFLLPKGPLTSQFPMSGVITRYEPLQTSSCVQQ